MRKGIMAAASLAVVGLVGPAGAWVDRTVNPRGEQPYCPSEDACQVDYDGHSRSWTITEVTP